MADVIRGYKAFHTSDDGYLRCRDMVYVVGETYALDGKPELCERGYHFCRRLVDCYDWYGRDSRICEVEASGVVIDGSDGKSVTNNIRIVRELDRHEVLDLENSGNGCTGIRNSGDWNSGDGNSGDGNSGDWNSGDRNSGDWNSGDWNSGGRNSGGRNSGDWNSGDWNSGNRNSGDWNKTNFSAGVLCTQEPECLIFDKPSGMTLREWRDTDAAYLMDGISIDTNRWIFADDMTDEEKAAHPDFAITDGYLRRGTGKPDFAGWWKGLNDDERAVILAIPNFDPEKWKLITGIEVS
ncbi:MAG: DUF7666 domain-containing protein [Olsenella sp.]